VERSGISNNSTGKFSLDMEEKNKKADLKKIIEIVNAPPLLIAFFFIALAVSVASLPALKGKWVYDDEKLAFHPLMDDWGDVLRAFAKTSKDYFPSENEKFSLIYSGRTYRPLSIASLAAINTTFKKNPLAHHIFSLILHLFIIAHLLRIVSHSWQGNISLSHAFLISFFALHPAMGEMSWYQSRVSRASMADSILDFSI